MALNNAKSFVVTFTKINVEFNYSLNDLSLVRKNILNDLVDDVNVMASRRSMATSPKHINSICASAYKNLRFVFLITRILMKEL